ncbi:uncharacterized protein SAPINGB_P005735 [Magnusiomyces paraingens]|uniref:GSKIP domain-containing protein n=1 Tax=Magnusiomyces paraingens TaxID=2606893 RepID=A0A5E8C1G8_9ASCO|nr:uncharacterized protein SAPINGB_P005735 [Saprochaete ingens]VVT57517.1 unnamed protein product [Saprochaete ingens]
MNPATIQEEYAALHREYALMVSSIQLPDSPTDPVRITTLEQTVLDTRLERNGWIVLALTTSNNNSQDSQSKPSLNVKNGAVFETPEALLMNVSPVFAQRWNAALTARLEEAFSSASASASASFSSSS